MKLSRKLSTITGAIAVAGLASLSTAAYAAKDIVVAVQSNFTTTDPYDANDTLSQAMAKSFYQGLYGFDKNMKMVPVLAESYSASKDGLVYTVKLKTGIKFHDGTPFNAEAVKVTFDRVTNPDNKLKRYNLYKNIAKTEAVDASTVRFTLKEPFSPFINTLAHPSGVIISPAALAKWGSKGIAQHPVGTGPFKFVEWKATDYLKVEKFDDYWRKGYPKVDSITWRPVVDNNTRAAVMQTNEAHFAFPMPPEAAESLGKKPSLEVTSAPSIIQRYLSFNTQHKPFDNPKVREAVNYAINKEALVKVAFSGYAIPAEGVLPKGIDGSTKLGPWPYNPAKARELLKEAGYPNGFSVELDCSSQQPADSICQAIAGMLSRADIKVLYRPLPFNALLPKLLAGDTSMYMIGWTPASTEPEGVLVPLSHTRTKPGIGEYNFGQYSNAKADEAIDKGRLEFDHARRTALFTEAMLAIDADAGFIPLIYRKNTWAMRKNVKAVMRPNDILDLRMVNIE